MPSSRRRQLVASLVLFLAISLLAERGESWPAFSRAVTPAGFGRIDDLVAVFDFNRDGRQDLLVGGNRTLSTADQNVFTNGQLFFGENSVPIDLNGDGKIDFVHTDLLAGPDRAYGTGDEVMQLVALVAR